MTKLDPAPGELAVVSVADLRRIAALERDCSGACFEFSVPDSLTVTAVDPAHVYRVVVNLKGLLVERDVRFNMDLSKLPAYVAGLDEKVDVELEVLEDGRGLGLRASRGHHRCTERLSGLVTPAPEGPKDLNLTKHTARYKLAGGLHSIVSRAEALGTALRVTGGKDVLEVSVRGNGDSLLCPLVVQCLEYRAGSRNVSSLYSVDYLGSILELLDREHEGDGPLELALGDDYPLLLEWTWKEGRASVDLASRTES